LDGPSLVEVDDFVGHVWQCADAGQLFIDPF
jgi:hypothetical protein